MKAERPKFGTAFCATFVLLFAAFGCKLFGSSKTVEIKSGRLKYIETLRYGSVGTHGSQGWYVAAREFFVNGRSWSPKEINVDDEIAGCEASPNEMIEALKCYSFKNNNEIAYLLRLHDNIPNWVEVYKNDYIKSRGDNLGEWIDEGKSLIFKDFFYNVETGEKQEIKGLPDYPHKYFRAVSPDLKIALYQGFCFNTYVEVSDEVKRISDKICSESERLYNNKLEVLWLVQIQTGETKLVEISRDKYDWLVWDQEKSDPRQDWLNHFQKQIVWEKDAAGKYQLVYPK